MALETCSDCQQPVSDAAKACPGCGRPPAATESHNAAKARAQTVALVVAGVAVALLLLLASDYLL